MKLTRKMLTLYIGAALLVAFCFTSHLTNGLYARYAWSDWSSDSARVAAFGVQITADNSFDLNQSLIVLDGSFGPGSTKTVSFSVDNTNSEVAVAFSVAVNNLTGDLPITTKLYSGTGDSKVLLDTGAGYLAPGEAAKQFTFEISWDSDKTDPSYAGKTDLLKLTVKAEQVD